MVVPSSNIPKQPTTRLLPFACEILTHLKRSVKFSHSCEEMRPVVRYHYTPIAILSTHHLCQRNPNCATGRSLPSQVPFEQGTVVTVRRCMSKSGRTLCNVLCGMAGWNYHSTTTTHPSTPLSSLKSNTSRKSTKRSHRPSTKQTLTSTRVA